MGLRTERWFSSGKKKMARYKPCKSNSVAWKNVTCTEYYRSWLGQHALCYNTNTWQSFSNTQPSFWFSLKLSKTWPSVSNAWLSVSKVWPHVLKQRLSRVLWSMDTLRVFDNLVCKKQPSYISYYFGRCSSELAQLVPLPFSRGRSTRYSDTLHDFSVTIPRCYLNSLQISAFIFEIFYSV